MPLHIDFETRSKCDLKVHGLSRYAKDPSTEILCLSYAAGSAKPKTWTPDQPIPKEILTATEIRAWNVAFESEIWRNIAAPQHGFPSLPLASCAMAQGRYSGLPGGLAMAGKALSLTDEAKSNDGHRLMLRMSKPRKPSKKNPAVWVEDEDSLTRLYSYCEQDVVAERAIDAATFPIPPFERRVWELDRKINERGLPIDLKLAHGAVRILAAAKENAFAELSELTKSGQFPDGEITSPWQVARILSYATRRGVNIDNLQEATLEQVVKTDIDKVAKRVLEIRLECRSAAAKKYIAAANLTDEDSRCRGQFAYHAAGTGRWCLTGDHEVLTRNGWERLDKWTGGEILCWNQNEVCSFSKAGAIRFPFSGELVHIDHKRIDQLSTPEHTTPCWYKGKFISERVDQINGSHQLPYTGEFNGGSGSVNADALRVLIMVQADGHYTNNGIVRLGFLKTRKIERCRRLLRRADIVFSEAVYPGKHVFSISKRHVPLYLKMFSDKTFREWVFDCNPDVFFEELELWDGSRDKRNKGGFQYFTTNKKNAEIVQTFAHVSGRAATMCEKEKNNPNWSPAFYVAIWANASNRAQVRPSINIKHKSFSGTVYCADTTTGFFYVRRNGKIWVTGNSSRGMQMHNFRRGSICSDQDAEVISLGDFELCKLVWGQKVVPKIGECVKGLICAPEGKILISSDLSGIENRVLHWLAGDERTLQLIREGADLYKVFATKVFDVPLDEVTGDQRTLCKPVILGSGYGMGAVKLSAYAAGMGITLTEEKAVGHTSLYRQENPEVVQLWKRCQKAAVHCVKTGKPVGFGYLEFRKEKDWMSISLPVGRKLYYHKPRLVKKEGRFGEELELLYLNCKGFTERTYGPKIVENVVQAIARDILCEGMLAIDVAGLEVVGHVHDSIIVLTDEDKADETKATVEKLITAIPSWAAGLPLNCETHTGKRYKS